MQQIKIMLPAYNEELSLPPLLEKIKVFNKNYNLNIEVIVVNDGSTDKTLDIANEHADYCLDLQPNGGLSNAMKQGLAYSIENMNDEDILVTMDADDSQPPELIFRMILQINEGSDIVIASRYRDGARIYGLSKFRKFLSFGAGALFKVFAPIEGVRDYTCGFRAYRVSLLKELSKEYGSKFIEQEGFGCMAEILLKSRKLNPIIHELPFILRYDQKQSGSKMNVSKTVKQTLQLLFYK